MKRYLRQWGADVVVLIIAIVSFLVLGVIQWKVIHNHLVKVGALPAGGTTPAAPVPSPSSPTKP
ncbi:hypothetical protein [Candidatus Methylacidithermus pantelleriae]|uniref:Uncharacterized protein n=1 Tax=Candidatus Methylacidithermus pantelleriae TaxID=2744239 RepID=A0A8J2FRH3_9BACT|nr:hypothetical protein [Candidatus Methylacidithermus pantelleriae]CAF0689955.1 hypothetical protein MPNT_10451 [Candidatus Methylacidithermus pantelleriae]